MLADVFEACSQACLLPLLMVRVVDPNMLLISLTQLARQGLPPLFPRQNLSRKLDNLGRRQK